MSPVAGRWAAAVATLVVTMSACASASPAPAAPSDVPLAAAPAPAEPALPVTSTVEFSISGMQRTAIVHRPGGARGDMPLVVVLHGAFGSAEQARMATGWDALADRDGFVVAYPNGAWHTWNAGRCCGPAHARGVDDVEFLHRLVDRLAEQEGVDRHRVYAVGMSNGAMMAYAWACGRPDDLAGIGPVAGARVADCPGAVTMSVVALHGTADRNVPIRGGVGPESVTRFNYPTLASSIAPFLAGDRCTPVPRRADRAPIHVSTFDCAAGAGVTVAVVDGLDHEWPSTHPVGPMRKLIHQEVAPQMDATAFLWSHLRSSSTVG